MIYRTSLGAFKVVLDATFHEFFGAPSAPFIGYRGYEKRFIAIC